MNEPNKIGAETARDVLGFFGQEGGWEAGGFATKLMTAIGHADSENRAKLLTVYPQLVTAMFMAQNTSDGISRLQKIVGIS